MASQALKPSKQPIQALSSSSSAPSAPSVEIKKGKGKIVFSSADSDSSPKSKQRVVSGLNEDHLRTMIQAYREEWQEEDEAMIDEKIDAVLDQVMAE